MYDNNEDDDDDIGSGGGVILTLLFVDVVVVRYWEDMKLLRVEKKNREERKRPRKIEMPSEVLSCSYSYTHT